MGMKNKPFFNHFKVLDKEVLIKPVVTQQLIIEKLKLNTEQIEATSKDLKKKAIGKRELFIYFNAGFNKTNNKMNSQRRTTHTAAL